MSRRDSFTQEMHSVSCDSTLEVLHYEGIAVGNPRHPARRWTCQPSGSERSHCRLTALRNRTFSTVWAILLSKENATIWNQLMSKHRSSIFRYERIVRSMMARQRRIKVEEADVVKPKEVVILYGNTGTGKTTAARSEATPAAVS